MRKTRAVRVHPPEVLVKRLEEFYFKLCFVLLKGRFLSRGGTALRSVLMKAWDAWYQKIQTPACVTILDAAGMKPKLISPRNVLRKGNFPFSLRQNLFNIVKE